MSKYHVGPNGPGKCTAEEGNCPYGGDSGLENHFDTMEKAQEHYERRLSDKYRDTATVSRFSYKDEVEKTVENLVNEFGGEYWVEDDDGLGIAFNHNHYLEVSRFEGKGQMILGR